MSINKKDLTSVGLLILLVIVLGFLATHALTFGVCWLLGTTTSWKLSLGVYMSLWFLKLVFNAMRSK